MYQIECIRVENTSPVIDNYLKKLIKEVGSDIKFFDWKNPAINNSGPVLMIADAENLPILKKKLEKRNEKIVIAFNSRKDFKLVIDLKLFFPKIFGFIDMAQEVEYNIPILNNYLNINFSKDSKLENLLSNLDKIYEFTKNELIKIKDLHERFVKIRVDQFKGVSLTNKFMAGEKSGGEFFEIIQNEQEILFIQIGSNSYLLSSMILSEFEILKEKSTNESLQVQMEKIEKLITHHADENNAELTYCMMILNLKTLHASFTLKGKSYLFYEGGFISLKKPLKINLKPGSRLCLLSEGAIKNWENLSKLDVEKFFVDNDSQTTKDLINEFFFEVSRNKSGSFLICDALMTVVEIEENTLYQLS